jgi:hypothetical protein
MTHDWHINGLRLPDPLVRLLQSGGWRHPGDDVLRQMIPWLHDPLDFLTTYEDLDRDNRLIAAQTGTYDFFQIAHGDLEQPVEMPWLDIDQAVFIAICRNAGDDIAIVLDYRTNPTDPRVLATDLDTAPARHFSWREVTPTFSQFIDTLQLA